MYRIFHNASMLAMQPLKRGKQHLKSITDNKIPVLMF